MSLTSSPPIRRTPLNNIHAAKGVGLNVRANAARLAAKANNEGNAETYEAAKSYAEDFPIDSMQYRLANMLYENLEMTIAEILPIPDRLTDRLNIRTYLSDKKPLYIDKIKDEIYTFIKEFPNPDLSIEMLVGFLHTRLENNPDILCAISLLLKEALPKPPRKANAPNDEKKRANVADIQRIGTAHTVAQILVKGIEKSHLANNLEKDADGNVIGLREFSRDGLTLCHAALSRDYSKLDDETRAKVSTYLEGWVEPAPNAPFPEGAAAKGGKRKTRKRSKLSGRKSRRSKLRIPASSKLRI